MTAPRSSLFLVSDASSAAEEVLQRAASFEDDELRRAFLRRVIAELQQEAGRA